MRCNCPPELLYKGDHYADCRILRVNVPHADCDKCKDEPVACIDCYMANGGYNDCTLAFRISYNLNDFIKAHKES